MRSYCTRIFLIIFFSNLLCCSESTVIYIKIDLKVLVNIYYSRPIDNNYIILVTETFILFYDVKFKLTMTKALLFKL